MFSRLRQCADQVAFTVEAGVSVTLTSDYSSKDGSWLVGASSSDPDLNFGQWEVLDATKEVVPRDEIAVTISSSDIICFEPVALITRNITAPLFSTTTPTPLPTRTPAPIAEPIVTSAEEAGLRVWVAVYNCYRYWPDVTSFVARQESPERWIVEGNSETTQYGLWAIDAFTAQITPLDPLAQGAASNCYVPPETVTSIVVTTAEVASHRVWVAVYSCFDPRPSNKAFTAFQDSPESWVVEGKVETVTGVGGVEGEAGVEGVKSANYGLWLVDSATAEITPLDEQSLGISETCTGYSAVTIPVVLNAEQAALRVWIAVYDCFNPRTANTNFTAFQDKLGRWFVEGKEAGEAGELVPAYGLWRVDSDTAEITPWDQVAKNTAGKSCYSPP